MADTCQSWRYHPHGRHKIPGPPGSCRKCWTSCNKIVPHGANRCSLCFELLVTNPSPEIRRAIALEPGASDATLRRLSDDPNYSVALSAANVLETRRRAAVQTRISTTHDNQFSGAPGAPAALPWAVS
jgi:hypothetical protein